jgi:anion-transporting  ArsA/GET3 family ATPase
VHKIFDAKFHFVAGKGGVGKTLISQALAMHFAENFTTLLVELSEENAQDEPKIPKIKAISKNLFHIKIFPDQALYEYLKLKIPEKLVDALLSKSIFRALSSAMPGLSDLTRLGKIWYHHKDYQKIVVDMPSSGFVSRFLSIAKVVSDAVKIGPLAKEAQEIADYLKDPNNARLHLVALPKELVVNETLELYKELKLKGDINLGFLMINRKLLDLELPQLADNYPQTAILIERYKRRKREEDLEIGRFSERGIKIPQIRFLEVEEMIDSKIISSMMNTLAGVTK